MKKTLYSALIAFVMLITQFSTLKADSKYDPKLKFKSNKNFSKEIIARDYEKAVKWHKKTAGSVFGASIDFQVGYNSTDPNATQRTSGTTIGSTSKGGVNFGAILNLSILGINLATGLDFLNKKYEVQSPLTYTDTLGNVIDSVKSYANQYLDIPLNLGFSTMVSDNVGISFSGGPYFGILLNPENAANGFKDFDLGLNGMLTGNYLLNPFMSIILGGKYQYGGLNNLLSNEAVEKVTTNTWGIFTGLRVGF